jgi:hypothetical protein
MSNLDDLCRSILDVPAADALAFVKGDAPWPADLTPVVAAVTAGYRSPGTVAAAATVKDAPSDTSALFAAHEDDFEDML